MKYFYYMRAGREWNDGGAIVVAPRFSDAEELFKKHYGVYPYDGELLGGCGIEDFPEFTKCLQYKQEA